MVRYSQAVELTRELIAFDTINPPGNEAACARYLGQRLEDGGFAVAYHDFGEGRANVVARCGKGDRVPLCFTGHLDTVPLGAAPWGVDPFAGEVAGERLYGRGSSDMKSGVAAFVVAAITAAQQPRSPDLVLVLTAGEETGAEGAAHLARSGAALGEAGALVVGEPTSNVPFVGHKGALWLEAHTRGVSAHGSMPERGVNAVFKAGRVLAKLEDFDFNLPPHEVLGKATLNVGTIRGGMNINSVPDHADIGIDIRTVPGVDHARLREALAGYLAPELGELAVSVDLEEVWTDPANPWVQDVFEIMAGILGEQPEPRGASYFTDASVLTRVYGGVPTIILGPGEAAMAHQTDEYCQLERIDQAVEAYRAIMELWQRG